MLAGSPQAPEAECETAGQLQVVFRGVGEQYVQIVDLDRANPEEAKDLHIQACADGSRKGISPSLQSAVLQSGGGLRESQSCRPCVSPTRTWEKGLTRELASYAKCGPTRIRR